MFGYASVATFRNVNLADCNITGGSSVGSLLGGAWKSTEGSVIVENCHVTGRIEGRSGLGGVAGTVSRIENSSFEGNISAVSYSGEGGDITYSVGGVVSSAADVISCYAKASVFGYTDIGGVAGNALRVRNCYFMGDVKGRSNIGGIVGSGAVIESCYVVATVQGYEALGGIAGSVATTYNTEATTVDSKVSHVLMAGGEIIQIKMLKHAQGYSFGGWVGRILGSIGSDTGKSEMYGLEDLPMYFTDGYRSESYSWEGDHFPGKYLFDQTAWPEVLEIEENTFDIIWKQVDANHYPQLLWETDEPVLIRYRVKEEEISENPEDPSSEDVEEFPDEASSVMEEEIPPAVT